MRTFKWTALAMALAFSLPVIAQDENTEESPKWKTGGNIGLTFTQTSLTNWAAGGENTLGTNGYLSLFANYTKGKGAWDNTLDLAYGILKQGEEDLRKSDDKIDFASKYGYRASKNWFYTALVSFKTQFSDGYKYPDDSTVISTFMAPAYLVGSFGMDYKPNDRLTVFLSPITAKFTMVNDDALSALGSFGLEPGEKFRSEFGGFVKVAFKQDLMENVNFQTKVDFFSNYADNPQNIDVNWEVLIAMKVNKFITANLSTQLIYDHDTKITDKEGKVGPRTQFKEIFGVGFAYKF
jgi:hypothetical protein